MARAHALPDPALRKTVNRDIFRMVLPVITENVLQMSAGLITSAMIGRLMADAQVDGEFRLAFDRLPGGVYVVNYGQVSRKIIVAPRG